MRPIRVCIYGGTDLEGMPTEFISALAYNVLKSMEAVLVTGGFRKSINKPTAISTDVAALRGARNYANDHNVNLKDCFEAWVPESRLDGRPDVGGVFRMTEEDGVTLRVMGGRTALGRRLAMVADVDVVVTISGRQHTEVVIEQALELRIPVVPIPNAGGDSKELLHKYRERIAARFDPGALEQCLRDVSEEINKDHTKAASAVISLIRTAKVGKCLVLLPYDDWHNNLYFTLIEPAIAKHMFPIRLDLLPTSEAIYTSFADAIQSCRAIIADITALNQNVMYEIGYAHGRGLKPLIYTQDAACLKQLPVYFRTLNVRVVSEVMPIDILIDGYLRSLKTAHGVHQPDLSTY